jgi:predicted DNA binding CopG/RHH family protein
MARKPKIPEFASPELANEEEEARWWPQQEDQLADAFEKAAENGTLKRGTLARRMGATPPTTIRLDPNDIARARQLAERKGLKYQTYLKMLLHEALEKAERAS